ncbi:MAG TPA: hypothetical protein VE377_02790 [Candidatus Dormibacteraeota bacterium]|nr:hypothetical protein [Candidatus Dormibacteraeota bacterium]
MNVTLLKALVVLVPGAMLLAGSIALFRRQRTVYSWLQLLGAGSLVVVVLTHVFEALHAFPWMGWGQESSLGHYVDLCSAIIAATLFPLGYLLHALRTRRFQ